MHEDLVVDPHLLEDAQGRVLLTIAREAVAEALGRGAMASRDEDWLKRRASSFVTLTLGGALRGCVGTIRPRDTLLEELRRNAVAAAMADPRFPALSGEELELTRFEVSVLSALSFLRVASEEELTESLEVGRHGVVLEWGPHRGTFLPQMWEQLPDPLDFVRFLKRKAGLPESFWEPDIGLWTFTVRAFHEPEVPH